MTEEERQDIYGQISALKQLLFSTDYESLKFSEGAMTQEEFEPYRLERAQWRALINEAEALLAEAETEE